MATFYLDYANGNDATTATPYGWWSRTYTNGNGTQPPAEQTGTGGTSGSTAKVTVVTVSSGTWAGGNAAGTIYWYGKSAAFVAETITFTNGATCSIAADFTYCAWKTLTNGATAARIAAGDTVRIAKSSDPTSLGTTALWTNNSKTVTVTIAKCINVDLCNSVWTAATNVTATTSTTRKEGSNSASLAIASGFTTGKVAYRAITPGNLSGYQQLSFWFQANATVASGVFKLCLCSDATGDVIVDEVTITAAYNLYGNWVAYTLDKGSALGPSTASIALYAISDPGTVTVLLDDVVACLAPSSADSLSLTSLISKSSSAQGGTEPWYAIKSINSSTVILDEHTGESATGTAGVYAGTTETVTTYKRETIKTTQAAVSNTVVQEIMDSGATYTTTISFQGGYDPATNQQNGATYFDGQTSQGVGIQLSGKSYITMDRIGLVKYNHGLLITSTCHHFFSTNLESFGHCTNYGVYLATNNYACYFGTILSCHNNNVAGFQLYNSGYTTAESLYCVGNNNQGFQFVTNSCGSFGTIYCDRNLSGCTMSKGVYKIKNLTVKNSITGVNVGSGVGNGGTFLEIDNLTLVADYNHFGLSGGGNIIKVGTATCNGSTFSSNIATMLGDQIYVSNYKAAGAHRSFHHQAVSITTVTDVNRHTASGIAWKVSPTSTNGTSYAPGIINLATFCCSANNLVTFKCWVKKSHATDIAASIVLTAYQIAGVTSDVTATKASDTNYEELTITFTPTADGVVTVQGRVWWVANAADDSVYFDDITITQA